MRRFIITRLVLLGGVALALATGLPAVIVCVLSVWVLSVCGC